MKKILSFVIAAVMLLSASAISVYAAADIEISMTGAEGKPGDIVEVNVYYDKNAGAYASRFYIHYDSRCFEFVERVSGDIFSDGETIDFVKDGVYYFYGSNNGTENTLGTGLLITLKFKILKAAPNGDYPMTLKLPEDIDGYFFDVSDISVKDYPARTVEVKNSAVITVTGSDAESLPETTTPPETEAATEKVTSAVTDKKEPATEIVTEFVTDAVGEIVTDVAGEPVVTDVVVTVTDKVTSPEETSATKDTEVETEIVYVTDAEGEQVTDVEGEPVTEIVEVEKEAPVSMNMIVIIVCVAAIVAAAVITVVVIASHKKNDEDNTTEE